MIRILVAAALASACGQSKESVPSRPASSQLGASERATLARLRVHLATARTEAEIAVSGEDLAAGHDVRDLVEDSKVRWWELLSPIEAFFLFETSPATAARAPIEVRARAYCAAVESIMPAWWGTPGTTSSEPQKRLLALGAPVAKCLVKLFDSTRMLGYTDGESNTEADAYAWTVADLAAGFVAIIVGASYDEEAEPAARAINRAALRNRLTAAPTSTPRSLP